MDIEFLIQRLEQLILKESPKLPFGARAVNEEQAQAQFKQLKESVPEEIRRARETNQQRDAILAQARQEAARILSEAQVEAQHLASEHKITQEARQQAALLRQQTEQECLILRADADEYVFDSLSHLQQELVRLGRIVENGLQKLETDREQRLQSAEEV